MRLAVVLLILAGVAVAAIETMAMRDSCGAFRQPGSEVWLALGQSNAANSARVRYRGTPGVMTFDGRRCLPAVDPLPGASGGDGSVWTALANDVVANGHAARVLVVSRAEGSTAIADWLPGAALFGRVTATIAGLDRAGLRVDRVFWQQGEADAILSTPGPLYAERLRRVTEAVHRATGAPVIVAVSGWCGDVYAADIRAAQIAAAGWPWVRPGPETDLVEGRWQRCHFDAEGQQQAVVLWRKALAFGLPTR